jgi:hypothetical protein
MDDFRRFSELAREAHGWGRNGEVPALLSQLTANMTIGDAALVRLSSLLESTVLHLARDIYRSRFNSTLHEISAELTEYIKEEEQKYGPIPKELHNYLQQRAHLAAKNRAAEIVTNACFSPQWFIGAPEKDHHAELRKAWNRWRRRQTRRKIIPSEQKETDVNS